MQAESVHRRSRALFPVSNSVTTYCVELFEDQDDDGDGIPDSLEGSFDQDGGQFDSVTLILLVICAAAVILFIMRSRKGLQK